MCGVTAPNLLSSQQMKEEKHTNLSNEFNEKELSQTTGVIVFLLLLPVVLAVELVKRFIKLF